MKITKDNPLTMSEIDYLDCIEERIGFCVRCGVLHSDIAGCAAEIICDECDHRTVFGIKTLHVHGLIKLEDSNDFNYANSYNDDDEIIYKENPSAFLQTVEEDDYEDD